MSEQSEHALFHKAIAWRRWVQTEGQRSGWLISTAMPESSESLSLFYFLSSPFFYSINLLFWVCSFSHALASLISSLFITLTLAFFWPAFLCPSFSVLVYGPPSPPTLCAAAEYLCNAVHYCLLLWLTAWLHSHRCVLLRTAAIACIQPPTALR